MYDDYGSTYDNTWDSIPDDDMEIIAMVLDDAGEVGGAMLDFIIEHETGISIGDEWYSWDKIKHIFD